MICPRCDGKTAVIAIRNPIHLRRKRRRRECQDCGYRFTSYEVFESDWKAIADARRAKLAEGST